jgi:hypothetical protein
MAKLITPFPFQGRIRPLGEGKRGAEGMEVNVCACQTSLIYLTQHFKFSGKKVQSAQEGEV